MFWFWLLFLNFILEASHMIFLVCTVLVHKWGWNSYDKTLSLSEYCEAIWILFFFFIAWTNNPYLDHSNACLLCWRLKHSDLCLKGEIFGRLTLILLRNNLFPKSCGQTFCPHLRAMYSLQSVSELPEVSMGFACINQNWLPSTFCV